MYVNAVSIQVVQTVGDSCVSAGATCTLTSPVPLGNQLPHLKVAVSPDYGKGSYEVGCFLRLLRSGRSDLIFLVQPII